MTAPVPAAYRYEISHRPCRSGSWWGDWITGRGYDDLGDALAAVEVARNSDDDDNSAVGEYGVVDFLVGTARIVDARTGKITFHRSLTNEEQVGSAVAVPGGLLARCTCGWSRRVPGEDVTDEHREVAWELVQLHGKARHVTRYVEAEEAPRDDD